MSAAKTEYDKSYWPDCGTTIAALPNDLNELWTNYSDQAETFVAESIVNESYAGMWLDIGDVEIAIIDPVWGIGGDTIVHKQPFTDFIQSAFNMYADLKHPEDQQNWLTALDKMEAAIKDARTKTMEKHNEPRSDDAN